MGACSFHDLVRRKSCPGPLVPVNGNPNHLIASYIDWPDAKAAFYHLCEEDRYENGHNYSGGIGMKNSFIHIATVDSLQEAEELADVDDPRVCDKWGPAGCITIREGDYQFLFFGWASS